MLMKTLAHLSGLLIIGITASHAEPAGPDDAIILDRTHYEYCQDNSNHIVSTAKPPYYVALRCINFHSTDPLLATKCNSYMKYSYCTAQECEKEVYRNSKPSPLGGSATMQNVCATADGYGGFEITRPAAQESVTEPSAKCNPTLVTLDSLYTRATIMCPTDYMDSKVGIAVHDMAQTCWNELPRSTINNLIKKGFDAFNTDVKTNGKPEACKKAGQTQEYLITQ